MNYEEIIPGKHQVITDENGEIPEATFKPRKSYSRLRVISINQQPSMTQQYPAEHIEINAIVERFKRTGILPEATQQPQYGDVTNLQGIDLVDLIDQAQTNTQIASEFANTWRPPEETPPATSSTPPADTPAET